MSNLDSILSFLYNEQKKVDKYHSWDKVLKEVNLNLEFSEYYLFELKTKDFLEEIGLNGTVFPIVKISSTGKAFISSNKSFKKFSLNMSIELVNAIDQILDECRKNGWLAVTKDTSKQILKAVREAKTRKWIKKKNNFSYELTSLGIEVNDFGSVENYFTEKKPKGQIINPPIQQTAINTGNVAIGDNHGTLNKSSDNFSNSRNIVKTMNKTENSKNKKSAIEWVAIILGIFVSIIAIYKFLIE